MGTNVNILSLNIASLNNLIKLFAKFLRSEKAAITYLQETHLRHAEVKYLKVCPGHLYSAFALTETLGVMLGISKICNGRACRLLSIVKVNML